MGMNWKGYKDLEFSHLDKSIRFLCLLVKKCYAVTWALGNLTTAHNCLPEL